MVDVQKAASIEIKAQTPTKDVVHQIFTACLQHVANNAAQIDDDVPEAVHQTRVGLRRTRSALSLFRKQVDSVTKKHLNYELRQLGAMLGPSRDWDVFLHDTLPKVQRSTPALREEQLERIRQSVDTKRDRSYDRHGDAVRLIANVAEELTNIALRGDELDEPIEELAPDLLARQARRVRRCLRHLNTPEQRHDMRKAVKKLRYSVEFMTGLFNHKNVKPYLDQCKALQEIFGRLNDVTTTIALCKEIPEASDLLGDWIKRQEERTEDRLADTIANFRSIKPFWH